MGAYSIHVQGIDVLVNVVDNETLVETHINHLLKSTLQAPTQVVGLDLKTFTHKTTTPPFLTLTSKALVLSSSTHSLILFLTFSLPKPLLPFLEDSRICFVKEPEASTLLTSYLEGITNNIVGVEVGELVTRVLKKPRVTKMSLADIARMIKVPIKGELVREVAVDESNPKVLTDDQVKLAVGEAVTCYQIGHKVLSSLQNVDYYLIKNGPSKRTEIDQEGRSWVRWFWVLLLLIVVVGPALSETRAKSPK